MTILPELNRAPAPAAPHHRSVVRPATQFGPGSGGRADLSRLDPAPRALAIPTEMNIEFGISWQAEQAWSYIVGDKR